MASQSWLLNCLDALCINVVCCVSLSLDHCSNQYAISYSDQSPDKPYDLANVSVGSRSRYCACCLAFLAAGCSTFCSALCGVSQSSDWSESRLMFEIKLELRRDAGLPLRLRIRRVCDSSPALRLSISALSSSSESESSRSSANEPHELLFRRVVNEDIERLGKRPSSLSGEHTPWPIRLSNGCHLISEHPPCVLASLQGSAELRVGLDKNRAGWSHAPSGPIWALAVACPKVSSLSVACMMG